jgi:hypothetical protein
MTNSLTVFLNGNGGIKHVVDEDGSGVYHPGNIQYVCGPQNYNGLMEMAATQPIEALK